MMPTSTHDTPLTDRLRPIAAGSPASNLIHALWLNTMGRPADGSSSPFASVRPSAAWTPSASKKFPVTRAELTGRPSMRVSMPCTTAKASTNTLVSRRNPAYSARVNGTGDSPSFQRITANSSPGFCTASTRKNTRLYQLNTAATSPRPRAIVATIVTAASGARRNVRIAYETSRARSSTTAVPRASRHVSAASATEPKRSRAIFRASSRVRPLARCFCVSRSTWKASSSSSSASTRRGADNARTRRNRSRTFITSRQFHHAPDGRRHPLPLADFNGQLPPSGRRQLVVLRAAAQLRHAPLGFNPSLVLEAMECRIERALIDLQDIFGDLLDAFRDRPAVQRLGSQRAEDEQVECARQKVRNGGPRHGVG